MSAETELFALLAASAGVGAVVADRIYPDAADQGADRPLIVYTRAATEYERTIGGTVAATRSTLAIACYSDTRAAAESAADAVTSALSGSAFDVIGRSGAYDPEVLAYSATVTVVHFA